MPDLQPPLLPTFFGAGFECSTHRRADGQRLDLVAATAHSRFAEADYRACREHGLGWARDGLRWHLAEPAPGRYDWSSWLPQLRAARRGRRRRVLGPLPLRLAGRPRHLAAGVSWEPLRAVSPAPPPSCSGTRPTPCRSRCPVNEPSFWSWAGGDAAAFNPSTHGRGFELKAQLVRAALAASEAVRGVDPRARLLHARTR